MLYKTLCNFSFGEVTEGIVLDREAFGGLPQPKRLTMNTASLCIGYRARLLRKL
jgi:hypothetical protein